MIRTLLPALALLAVSASAQMVEGKADSPVRVMVYEDLQCPDCAAFRRMLDEHLLPRYGAKVAFLHRDFPLARHAWARRAAIAARHFGEVKPGLGIEWRRYILANLAGTTEATLPQRIEEFARKHGAGAAQAVAALDNPKYAAQVEADFQDGVARGVAKTPTVFVNGVPFIERFTVEDISKALDQALQDAR